MHSTKKIYLHSLECRRGLSNKVRNLTFFLGDWEHHCVTLSSLCGSSLSPLSNIDSMKTTGSIRTPGQPHYSWWQPISVLDFSTHHGAADWTALLRCHLLAPLNPWAPWRCQATVWGVVCPPAPSLRAQPAIASQGRLVGVRGFALRTRAGSRARPRAVARGYSRT